MCRFACKLDAFLWSGNVRISLLDEGLTDAEKSGTVEGKNTGILLAFITGCRNNSLLSVWRIKQKWANKNKNWRKKGGTCFHDGNHSGLMNEKKFPPFFIFPISEVRPFPSRWSSSSSTLPAFPHPPSGPPVVVYTAHLTRRNSDDDKDKELSR